MATLPEVMVVAPVGAQMMLQRERECRHIARRLRGLPLPADLAAFHLNTALVCAQLCRLTYLALPETDYDPEHDLIPCDPPYDRPAEQALDITQLLQEGDIAPQSSFVIDTYFLKVVGVRLNEAIFVAIRGSKGVRDWLTNLQSWTETISLHASDGPGLQKLQVHAGFMKLINQIRRGIAREVEALGRGAPDRLDVVVTGHSLGGALALLFAARFNEVVPEYWGRMGPEPDGLIFRRGREREQTVASVYTFGAPMVGKEMQKASLNAMHHRIVRDRDLVPFLPSTAVGFEHDTDALLFTERGPNGLIVRQHEDGKNPIRATMFDRHPIRRAFE